MKAPLREDIETNKAIGANGAKEIKTVYPSKKIRILTHCNTGSLATAGYGTALGVIRALFENNELDHAFCTETRPYNQESFNFPVHQNDGLKPLKCSSRIIALFKKAHYA